MFRRLLKPIAARILQPTKIFTCAAILAYTIYKHQVMLINEVIVEQSDPQPHQPDKIQSTLKNLEEYIKQLQSVEVCEGKHLQQGGRKLILVKDFEGKDRKIMIFRIKGKLFAISGVCPHKQPLDSSNEEYTLEKSLCINDKLFCPHHGCIFDIKSGSVEHGPALNNLAIFLAQQTEGLVKLTYPLAIPKYVAPNYAERDIQDLRKVLIIGGDDAATIGCINGLRQFGFQGEISVVKEGTLQPFRKEYLHKSIVNLHLDQQMQDKKGKVVEALSSQQVDSLIKKALQQKIYKKLQYYTKKWYQIYGIDFILNEEPYRIINKQFYPYITFADGTKQEFDALLLATGVSQKLTSYDSINVDAEGDTRINLPENVFSPFRSKEQHSKLLTFLNKNTIRKLLVLGYSIESLEFIQALNKEFPQIKVTVIDNQQNSPVSQLIGPDLEAQIAKEFTSRGVEFFIKVRDELLFSNRFSQQNRKKGLEMDRKMGSAREDKLRYDESVTVRISDELRIKADGVVLFPHEFVGNTEWVKNGKYTDFDYWHSQRLGGDTFCRTQNIRIFTAGLSSANQYYLTGKRLVNYSSNLSYEQGMNVALNMQALRVPFTYVPLDTYHFFNKRLLYLGTRDFYDSVLIMGSVQEWDFLAIYSLGNKVNAVTASPSRSKQINILREALRVNCIPLFQQLTSGYWSIQNLEKLIKKLGKTGCYRDLIFQNRQNIHKKDLVWMERSPDAGFENDRPIQSEQYPSVEVGEGGVLKEL